MGWQGEGAEVTFLRPRQGSAGPSAPHGAGAATRPSAGDGGGRDAGADRENRVPSSLALGDR